MKYVLSLVMGSVMLFGSSVAFSQTNTTLDGNWICTTNASASSVNGDKAADEKMGSTASAASDAFAFASTHCRDCTKITCTSEK